MSGAFNWPERDEDLATAKDYAEGGPAVSRKAVGRIVSHLLSTEALLEGSRERARLFERMAGHDPR